MNAEDGGRPFVSANIYVDPCYAVNDPSWFPGGSDCYRAVTQQELNDGKVYLNTTGAIAADYAVYVQDATVWFDPFVGCDPTYSSAVTISIVDEIYADVIFPSDIPSTVPGYVNDAWSVAQTISINLDYDFNINCIKPLTAANVTFKYLWEVRVPDPRRRALSERRFAQEQILLGPGELLFNATTLNLNVPKGRLPTFRTEPGRHCGACQRQYSAKFTATMVYNNTETTIFDTDYLTAPDGYSFVVVPLLVFDLVKATVAVDGTITVDATATCDPNVAKASCDPTRGFNPSLDPFRGLYFKSDAVCQVFDDYQRQYRLCNPSDFFGSTEAPTSSPVTGQPTMAPTAFDTKGTTPPTLSPIVPTGQPTTFYSGLTKIGKPKPGVYRFLQPLDTFDGTSYYSFPAEDTSCNGLESSNPTGLEPECLLPFSVLLEVLPEVPNCARPQVQEPFLPYRVTIQPNSPFTVPFTVTVNTQPVGSGVTWEVQGPANNFLSLATLQSSGLFNTPGFVVAPTRPTLIIPANTLFEGKTYTFRMTAHGIGSGCTTETDVLRTVTFYVNSRPAGGQVTISPPNGKSFVTAFVISTSGWTDIESDLPLKYSFELVTPSLPDAVTVSNFDVSPSVTTKLSSGSVDGNYIVAIAQDSLGARSSVKSAFIKLDPLYVPGEGVSNLPDPSALASGLANQPPDDQLRTLAALAASAAATRNGTIEADDEEFIKNWRKGVANAAVDTVLRTRQILGGGGSIRQVALQVNTLLLGLSSEPNLGDGTLEDVSSLIQNLLADAQGAFSSATVGSSFTAADFLPTSFSGSLLNVLTQLAKGIEQGIQTLGLRRLLSVWDQRRELQGAEQAYARSVQNLRASLNTLIATLMQGNAAGGPVQVAQGVTIEIAVAREERTLVGDQITTLSLGDITVTLPSNVLDAKYVKTTEDVGTVDVALVRFRFNVRELVKEAKLPPGFDRDNINITGVLADNFTVSEITTLLFLSSKDPTILLDPSNLTVPINITIPLPAGYQLPNATATGLEPACGAWDTSFGGWSDSGAKVVAIDLEKGLVTCSSTHASDFAVWNAFVANLGGGAVGIILLIAAVVVGIMVPVVLILYFLSMFWAWRKDKKDAEGVHTGALLLLTKNKLRLRAKQRKFFQLLRDNAKAPQPLVVDLVKARQLRTERVAMLKKLEKENEGFVARHLPAPLLRWAKAFWYDHSFVGVFTRFDPYYTRTQRVTVVTCIVCGNLFIASFFFDLKTAKDITFGFMFGVVVLAALIVAIPIKIFIRVLFRLTEATTGSMMDRVTQIYRVSLVNQDIVPVYASAAEQADIEMILAFREYYLAKRDLATAQDALHEAKRRVNGDSLWDKIMLKFRFRSKFDEASLITKSKMVMSHRNLKGLDKVAGGEYSIPDLEDAVREAETALRETGRELKARCAKAKEEWERVPRLSARVETLRKQQSTIMKFAALLYDEAEAGPPRERTKKLRWWFIFVAWFIVIAYLVTCLVFTSYWLLAYTSIKPGSESDKSKDANQVILLWLEAALLGIVVGLFIAEPFFQFLRFAIVPAILMRYGNGIVSSKRDPVLLEIDDDQTIADDNERLAVRVDTDDKHKSMAAKADLGDAVQKKIKGKKGETNAETASIAFFDVAADAVDIFT